MVVSVRKFLHSMGCTTNVLITNHKTTESPSVYVCKTEPQRVFSYWVVLRQNVKIGYSVKPHWLS